MKIERLISILMLLLSRKKLTAKELADYFEVSVRTIQRDIDSLCEAGIPVYGDVGKTGGYQLSGNYRLDRGFLTGKEMDALVTMLNGFSDTLFGDSVRTILEKISGTQNTAVKDAIRIDLTPWGPGGEFTGKFSEINRAVEQKRLIRFEYYDLFNNKTERTAEPYKTVFKGASWYVFAFCLLRGDYRLFRIGRLFSLEILDSHFRDRENVPDPDALFNLESARAASLIRIKFSPEARGKIPDFFDPREARVQEDGYILYELEMPVDEWLIAVFLGFGPDAEVLSPESLRDELKERIKKANSVYS